MKTLQSKIENNWIEIIPVNITSEELTILNSKDVLNIESKLVLQNKIMTDSKISANEADVIIANSLYNSIKPVLIESDVYELIEINLFINKEKTSGVLSYKLNDVYKQYKF